MHDLIVIKNRLYYKNRIESILPFLELYNASILDLGCGEMVLYDVIKERIISYTGVDIFPYKKEPNFILGNLLDASLISDKKYDLLFLLGVVDHMDMEQKHQVLLLYKEVFRKQLIISQKNPFSWINKWIQKDASCIEIEAYFNNHQIQIIPILKFPLWSKVFNLSNATRFFRKWSTENIYIISKAQG